VTVTGLKTARCRFGGLRSANIAWLHPRISARARILSRTSAQPPQSRPELSGGPESLTPVAGTLASVQSPTEPNAERRVHTPEATQIAQIRRGATDRAIKPTGAQITAGTRTPLRQRRWRCVTGAADRRRRDRRLCPCQLRAGGLCAVRGKAPLLICSGAASRRGLPMGVQLGFMGVQLGGKGHLGRLLGCGCGAGTGEQQWEAVTVLP
jgi:hypothetical protein